MRPTTSLMARRTLILTAICAVLARHRRRARPNRRAVELFLGAGERLQRHAARRAGAARRRRLQLGPLGPLHGAVAVARAAGCRSAAAATSPWQSAGSAEYTWGQAGWTFSISVPPGHQYQLRAVAELRWSGETNRTETHTTGTCTVGA